MSEDSEYCLSRLFTSILNFIYEWIFCGCECFLSNQTLLTRACSLNNQDKARAILDDTPETERMPLIYGSNALLTAIESKSAQTFSLIISHIPESERMMRLSTPEIASALNNLSESPDIWSAILAAIPEAERVTFLNRFETNPIAYAISKGYLVVATAILAHIPTTHRLPYLTRWSDREGHDAIFASLTLSDSGTLIHFVDVILECLPENDKLNYLSVARFEGLPIWESIYAADEFTKVILRHLTPTQLERFLADSFLAHIMMMNDQASIKLIVNHFPEGQHSVLLNLLRTQNIPLTESLFKNIFESLPQEERVAFVSDDYVTRQRMRNNIPLSCLKEYYYGDYHIFNSENFCDFLKNVTLQVMGKKSDTAIFLTKEIRELTDDYSHRGRFKQALGENLYPFVAQLTEVDPDHYKYLFPYNGYDEPIIKADSSGKYVWDYIENPEQKLEAVNTISEDLFRQNKIALLLNLSQSDLTPFSNSYDSLLKCLKKGLREAVLHDAAREEELFSDAIANVTDSLKREWNKSPETSTAERLKYFTYLCEHHPSSSASWHHIGALFRSLEPTPTSQAWQLLGTNTNGRRSKLLAGYIFSMGYGVSQNSELARKLYEEANGNEYWVAPKQKMDEAYALLAMMQLSDPANGLSAFDKFFSCFSERANWPKSDFRRNDAFKTSFRRYASEILNHNYPEFVNRTVLEYFVNKGINGSLESRKMALKIKAERNPFASDRAEQYMRRWADPSNESGSGPSWASFFRREPKPEPSMPKILTEEEADAKIEAFFRRSFANEREFDIAAAEVTDQGTGLGQGHLHEKLMSFLERCETKRAEMKDRNPHWNQSEDDAKVQEPRPLNWSETFELDQLHRSLAEKLGEAALVSRSALTRAYAKYARQQHPDTTGKQEGRIGEEKDWRDRYIKLKEICDPSWRKARKE